MLAAKFLPLGLAFIMFGLGLSLTRADFLRILKVPRPVIIGLLTQMLLLPLFALGICKLFGLSNEFSIGMMILAASPGGVTANIYSHLARGDVALNITLTAVNSVLAAVSLPLIVGLSIAHFAGAEQQVGFQFKKAIEVFAIVLVPVIIGMVVKARKPDFADRMDRPIRVFSILLLVVLIVAAIAQEREKMLASMAQLGGAVLLFNLLSLAVGYLLPLLIKLPRNQAIAISMEVGIHNGTLAIYMALSVLNVYAYAMPAALYSVLMFFTAGLFTMALNARRPAKTLAPTTA
ncbi:MAG: Na+-dependent transporter [Candidatus Xenobia bacterium]